MPRGKRKALTEQSAQDEKLPTTKAETTAQEPPDVFDEEIAKRQAEARTAASQVETPVSPVEQPQEGEKKWSSKEKNPNAQPDPFGEHGMTLGDGRRAHFTTDRKYQQNGIFFTSDEEEVSPKPTDAEKQLLRDNGFRPRREDQIDRHGNVLSPWVWTKQFARNTAENPQARGDSAREAHEFFVEFVNSRRAANGLPPEQPDFPQNQARDR